MRDSLPIGAEEFARWLAPLGPFPPDTAAFPVAVAVSGGADSMALAWLLRRWRRHVVALIVDHGLRPESAPEAATTRRWVGQFGVCGEILTLSGLRRDGALQEGARAARYEALVAACRERGIVDLFVAHHAWDQTETVAMRARAGSGVYGLAGMAIIREMADCRLLRPLLHVTPDRLRTTLRAADVPWIEDPSNQNTHFERVRFRQTLDRDARAHLSRIAAGAGRERDVARMSDARELDAVLLHPLGFAILPPELIGARALARLWCVVTGGEHAPPYAAMEALANRPTARTLSGGMLTRAGKLGAGWLLLREFAATEDMIAAGEGVRWDRRWVMRTHGADVSGISIGALGDAASRYRASGWPSVILRGLPALYREGAVVGVPGLGVCSEATLVLVRMVCMTRWGASEASRWSF